LIIYQAEQCANRVLHGCVGGGPLLRFGGRRECVGSLPQSHEAMGA